MWMELLIFSIVIGLFVYRWARHNHDFFEKRNVPHEKHVFFFGGGVKLTFRKESMVDQQIRLHNKHDGIVYGTFDNRDPVFLLRDPQLIKAVMIKDFDHFVNRRFFLDDNEDNMFTRSLLLMRDNRWRNMRSTLSPAFTGSKMRQMFDLMLKTMDEAMQVLHERAASQPKGFELDVKDFATRLTTDIIASSAFGLQMNSFRDKDNEFHTKSKKLLDVTILGQLRIMTLILFPKLAKLLQIEIFDKEYTVYFSRLVLDAMKYRAENGIHRPDMINLLMEASGLIPNENAKNLHNWSDIEMVGQCFIFFFAALEPLSTAMGFAMHELMEYPEVQKKLYQEILEVSQEHQSSAPSYEILQKMPYLEMVVSEVLRKWPVTLFTERECNKDYVYESETGEKFEFRKGDYVRLSMVALHRDPMYYKNPEVFDPERFSEENKANIVSGTYMPFGLGPRICIGNRYALLNLKAFLFYMIRDYRLEASPQSCLPMQLEMTNLRLRPKTGFWVQCVPRK